jgi:formate hydrogenlyase subunit 3/multisubunit Na+/H+ antiporter MnhD subunit
MNWLLTALLYLMTAFFCYEWWHDEGNVHEFRVMIMLLCIYIEIRTGK